MIKYMGLGYGIGLMDLGLNKKKIEKIGKDKCVGLDYRFGLMGVSLNKKKIEKIGKYRKKER